KPPGGDFQKYAYTYRVWGRVLYHPDAAPEGWQRARSAELGKPAEQAEAALWRASRILPLVTTAHDPSAANNSYWPEMYTNMPIAGALRPHPYSDTPAPKRFGTVSPLDPELFASVEECAAALLEGGAPWKYTPLEVADWLEELAADAGRRLASAASRAGKEPAPAFR